MIPELNQKAVVRIICGASQGSGWFLQRHGYVYLVSAHHVFFEKFRDRHEIYASTCIIHGFSSNSPGFTAPYELEVDLKSLNDQMYLRRHPSRDLIAFLVGRLETGGFRHIVAIKDKMPETFHPIFAQDEAQKNFEAVEVGWDVFVVGYPSELGAEGQLDDTRPMCTKGIVSSKNATNKRLVLNAPVFPGNSGGLVSEVRLSIQGDILKANHAVIGTVTELVPWQTAQGIFQNTGYSIVEPVDAANEVTDLIYDQILRDEKP